MRGEFKISKEALVHLKKDLIFKEFIGEIGELKVREIIKNPFLGMIYIIIGQQISVAAEEVIYGRYLNLFGEKKPAEIVDLDFEELKSCGLTNSKTKYIKNWAMAVTEKPYLLSKEWLERAKKEDLRAEFLQIKGIGLWSIEMFLIFTLKKEDISSYGDLGLRNGIKWLYGLSELDEKTYNEYTKSYSPYNTAASFYLWEISTRRLNKKYNSFNEYLKVVKQNKTK